jgi:hypothetical protein
MTVEVHSCGHLGVVRASATAAHRSVAVTSLPTKP